MKETSWKKRRNYINHDWLKNVMIIRLGSIIKNLSGEVTVRRDHLLEMCQERMQDWSHHKQDLVDLISSYSSEMSPRTLFAQPPLLYSSPDVLDWLPEIIHSKWLDKYLVEDVSKKASEALVDADTASIKVICLLSTTGNDELDNSLLLAELINFQTSIALLSAAISRFQNQVKI